MPSDNGPLLRTLAPALRELERRLRARLSAKRRDPRSEEGRVGEKGRSRWAPHHLKKKKLSVQLLTDLKLYLPAPRPPRPAAMRYEAAKCHAITRNSPPK